VPSHLHCAIKYYINFFCRKDDLVLLELLNFHFGQELLQLVMGKSLEKAPLLQILYRDILPVFNPSLFIDRKENLLKGLNNRLATQIVVLQQHKEIFKVALKQLSVFGKNYKTNPEYCLHNFFVLFESVVFELIVPKDVLSILESSQQSHDKSSNILVVIETRSQRL
jgi:hypothetical protein